MKNRYLLFLVVIFIGSILFLSACKQSERITSKTKTKHPRIVNIINFVRLCEPRNDKITENMLYATVVKQLQMMEKYHLKGTFLLQYDALLDPRYQRLFKSLPDSLFEIGAWWEIPEPLVKNAGMKWRGKYPWTSKADVDFSVGYSPQERKRLVDTYMSSFKRIFGYYPKSVGSWFIDAYTLNYMHQKYGIIASCNCKDQVATDGYTLWGGYWNQGYYPSLKNAYMPAQNQKMQIRVPVFRMLGSDPIRQYGSAYGNNGQGVITLEPVYKYSGGDSAWVNWYFREFVEGKCMKYAYVQVGQENSFTWKKMSKGFHIQLPMIARLRDEKKLKVETLSETGRWFRKHFKVTPATSVTVNKDFNGNSSKTVWFDSRFYRANLLWENGTLRFRDIHLFNENFASHYLAKKDTSNKFSFFTLPFVDGYFWSSPYKVSGLWFKVLVDGKEILMVGKKPVITDSISGELCISWPLKSIKGTLKIFMNNEQIKMEVKGIGQVNWFLDLVTDDNAKLPFKSISNHKIDCQFKGMDYDITTAKGSFLKHRGEMVFKIKPYKNTVILNL